MQSTENEEWAVLQKAGWPYEISTLGRVRNSQSGRLFTIQISGHGYLEVTIRQKTRVTIHRAMAIAFIPNPDDLPFVRHLNDVRTDCRLENLAWGTWIDNYADRIRNGNLSLPPVPANLATRTMCAREHPLDEKNTYVFRGRRICRACNSAAQARRKARRAQGDTA